MIQSPSYSCLSVDDLIVITKTKENMERIKRDLTLKFKMKDMGKLHFCLGVHIDYDLENKILLMHQKQYIMKLLEKYQLTEANPVSAPANIEVKLQKNDGQNKEVDPVNYQSMVGSLLYAAVATHPDIAQASRSTTHNQLKPI